ncbi:hypothetical protein RFI_01084, partial [Reticulomyxa filosa]
RNVENKDCLMNLLFIRKNIYKLQVIILSYHLLGIIYDNKKEHEKEIECYENALAIRKKKFGNTNSCDADLHWNLGLTFKIIGKREISNKHFEEAWKIYNIVLGMEYRDIASKTKDGNIAYKTMKNVKVLMIFSFCYC